MHEAVDRTGFLSLHGNEDAWVEIYEGYLDEVIDLPVDHVKLETKVVSLWKQRGDADAFLERGN